MSDGHRTDAIDHLAGLEPGSPLFELRRQRPEIVRHMQASDDAILRPHNDGGLTHAERAAVALRIASAIRDARLVDHYRAEVARLGSAGAIAVDARLGVILAHADRLTADPDAADPAHLAALSAAGLSNRAILGLSQVIAYVNYQARVLAGLRALGATP